MESEKEFNILSLMSRPINDHYVGRQLPTWKVNAK
jgi:hypothetical protein